MPLFIVKSNLLLLGLIIAGSLSAQERITYSLRGYMGIQGGESFHYNLELKDSSGNFLSGYSYTFADGEKDVKTWLTAQKDPSAKTLHIREKEIVYNHYFQSKAVICLVDALLTYDTLQGALTGPLITRTTGQGATCSQGSITFNNAAAIKQLFYGPAAKKSYAEAPLSLPAESPKRVAPVKTIVITRPVKTPDAEQPHPANITSGKDGTYEWHSDKIILSIWDGNEADNDRVTLLYNGEQLLDNYTLTKDKKTITLPIGGNELNIISIVALNEGNTPPNTANIAITDGDKTYDIIAHNEIGKRASIMIKKAEKQGF